MTSINIKDSKISPSVFCDLQGVNDRDRRMIERKFGKLVATYSEWHATLTKEGYDLKPLRNFEPVTQTDKK